jgi:hypothetical protein
MINITSSSNRVLFYPKFKILWQPDMQTSRQPLSNTTLPAVNNNNPCPLSSLRKTLSISIEIPTLITCTPYQYNPISSKESNNKQKITLTLLLMKRNLSTSPYYQIKIPVKRKIDSNSGLALRKKRLATNQ